MCSNGSSLPPRLPGLSQVLKAPQHDSSDDSSPLYTIVALSYRGFWTSKGRPSEHGIKLDAATALAWISQTFPATTILVLWGQSIGAGVAVAATVANLQHQSSIQSLQPTTYEGEKEERLKIQALLLETPFTSIKDMLAAIYPQTWLPYRYLWPFLRNHWDSRRDLGRLARSRRTPKTLILQAGKDELVPRSHGEELENISKDGGIKLELRVVDGALHHEVLAKPLGRAAVVDFLMSVGEQG